MARLALPDAIYNWMIDFLSGHSHCTKLDGRISELTDIMASVIQGSAIGPASFILAASDLQPAHAGNSLVKFADDYHLIVCNRPSSQLRHQYKRADECSDLGGRK